MWSEHLLGLLVFRDVKKKCIILRIVNPITETLRNSWTSDRSTQWGRPGCCIIRERSADLWAKDTGKQALMPIIWTESDDKKFNLVSWRYRGNEGVLSYQQRNNIHAFNFSGKDMHIYLLMCAWTYAFLLSDKIESSFTLFLGSLA